MQIRTFTIPIHDDGGWADELNRFLASHRVLEVEREFVQDGSRSCWCFCVGYLGGGAVSAAAAKGRRIDYKEVLDEATFGRFAELRRRRKAIAEADGVPAFAVFTDEQLAGMAKVDELTPAAMAKVKGVGAGKIERYAARMLATATGNGANADGDAQPTDGAPEGEDGP